MVKVGETVKYGAYGECEICDRREEFLGGRLREFFILKQKENSAATIYVPVEKSSAFKQVKNALTVDEVKALAALDGEFVNWKDDDKTRDLKFRQAFERTDIEEIAGILKNIIARQNELKAARKKMRATDLNAAKICERILYDELSRSIDVKPEEITALITGQIEPKAK